MFVLPSTAWRGRSVPSVASTRTQLAGAPRVHGKARRETREVGKHAVNLAVVEVRAAGLVFGFVGAKMGKGDVPL